MNKVALTAACFLASLIAWESTISAQTTTEEERSAPSTEQATPEVDRAMRELQHGNVDEAIKLLEEVLEDDPENEQALFAAAQAYSHHGIEMARKDRKAANVPLRRGAKLMRRLAELKDDLTAQEKEVLAVSVYNEACCFAIDGKTDKAIKRLKEAVELGFDDAKLLADDSDFASIREDERFEKILASLKDAAE